MVDQLPVIILHNSENHLRQRGLPAAALADQAENIPLADLEAHIAQNLLMILLPPKKHMPDFSRFTEHFRHMDSETLLLLALLWLLYQEKADRKLLLALAYIVL